MNNGGQMMNGGKALWCVGMRDVAISFLRASS